MTNRGQAHALEGIIASFLLIGALIFALQATAVTPLSASTSSQQIENQLESTTRGALATSAESGALKVAVLNWDETNEEFYGVTSGQSYYVQEDPKNRFGESLQNAFAGRGIVYNVFVNYQTDTGQIRDRRMVYRGEPSDNAVTVTWQVALFDEDVLYDANEDPTGTELISGDFYAPDMSSSNLYNVIEVEVVVWRQ